MLTDDTIHSCSYYCDRPECIKRQRDDMRERLEELSLDAQRYRWLRDSDGAGGRIYCAMDQFEADGQCIATLLSGGELDAAIDAAMREHGGAK